jgi:hypothetical protein
MFLKSSIIGILTMVFGVLFLFQNEIIFETRADCETQVITIGDVTVASCNVGAEVAGTGISSYGHYFQRDDWSNFLNDKGE